MVLGNGIAHLWRYPHPAARAMLLEMMLAITRKRRILNFEPVCANPEQEGRG
jgi:hypothetical protein